MKRRILLVDDDVAVLLTMKAVLEISGFDVETAASARDGKLKLRHHEYHMVITDMRMESDAAGAEVIAEARAATYRPAVALLTAFPMEEDDWQEMGADKMLVKPMHTRHLLQQIEKLMASHEQKLKIWSTPAPKTNKAAKPASEGELVGAAVATTPKPVRKTPAKRASKPAKTPSAGPKRGSARVRT
jgi:DNA-binding response OmpR family regulator